MRRYRLPRQGVIAIAALLTLGAACPGLAADVPYPFEGTWIRAERACTPTAVRARTYTGKDVVSPRGRCAIRRIAGGSGTFELLEECRRNDRPTTVTETIRLSSPDAMTLKRQLSRLKIARQVRYMRCSPSGGAASPRPAKPAPSVPKG